MYWYSLSQELRRMVLEFLRGDEKNLICYVSVCREWRQELESTAFRQIHIKPPRISHLVELAHSRRAYLECINFHISLPEYDCSQCSKPQNSAGNRDEGRIVATALRSLFHAMCSWKSSDRELTLSISISSPSDTEHYVNTCKFRKHKAEKRLPADNLCHKWGDGQQVKLPSSGAVDRIFSLIKLDEDFGNSLPQVAAVTRLQIPRQSNRQMTPTTLQQLLPFLPMLQTFIYEPWRGSNRTSEDITDIDFWSLVDSLTRSRLKRLTTFENSIDHHTKIPPLVSAWGSRSRPHGLSPRVVDRALAEASLTWESLSMSFLVDAVYFFSMCRPHGTWSKLTTLTLTSRALAPGKKSYITINGLLENAATFAINAPNLTTLTLWNFHGANACAFIYEASEAERWAKITWRATWTTTLESSTISSWKAVALMHAAAELSVVWEELDASAVMRSRDDAAQQLEILDKVTGEE